MIDFYKDRVCLNVLVKDLDNAKEVIEAAEGHVLIGLLSKDHPDVDAAVTYMEGFIKAFDNKVSVGLGNGDAGQAGMVKDIAAVIKPDHANQVFTCVGQTRQAAGEDTWVNCLVSPSGEVGKVIISTGQFSEKEAPAIVDVKTAIAMAKEMGADSLKFFPMKGTKALDELKVVAEACAETGFALEPTGGIDLDNYEIILKTILDAGVGKVIPHVYSSIIDKATGETRPEDVKRLLDITKELLA